MHDLHDLIFTTVYQYSLMLLLIDRMQLTIKLSFVSWPWQLNFVLSFLTAKLMSACAPNIIGHTLHLVNADLFYIAKRCLCRPSAAPVQNRGKLMIKGQTCRMGQNHSWITAAMLIDVICKVQLRSDTSLLIPQTTQKHTSTYFVFRQAGHVYSLCTNRKLMIRIIANGID